MKKIKLNLAVSLDGYIAGPNGEYDWCFTDADYGLTDFIASIDSLLIGRKTYEIMLQYGDPYPGKTNYVFSRSLTSTPYDNVVIVNQDIPTFVQELRKKDGKDVWLYGGAEIVDPLYEHNLIDEMVLSIHPVILGGGISLFKTGTRRTLALAETTPYPSGLVQLTYKKI